MHRALNKLTFQTVRNAAYKGKGYKLFDGGGLFLRVDKNGRYWQMKYRYGGREKTISFGPADTTSLLKAREARDEAKKLLEAGIDPVERRRERKAQAKATADRKAQRRRESKLLREVTDEWLKRQRWSVAHRKRVESRIQRFLIPSLGHWYAEDVTAHEIYRLVRRVEKAGTINTARRLKQDIERIYNHATTSGSVNTNPAFGVDEALSPVPKANHFKAPETIAEFRDALLAIDSYDYRDSAPGVALRLAPYLMVRPKELRCMRWDELLPDKGLWIIPSNKMKTGRDHIVPLARQCLELIESRRPENEDSPFVFPAYRERDRPIPGSAFTVALRRMRYAAGELTVHGLSRATSRTFLEEILEYPADWIEHQLAHTVKAPNGRAYNRTTYVRQRKDMMQQWADFIDAVRDGTYEGGDIDIHALPDRSDRRG